MADKKNEEDYQPANTSVTENAAREYGLEDHEATQQDPRVHEMRRAESHHASRTASRRNLGARKSRDVERTTNVAINYGLEGRKADHDDPRVTQIRSAPGTSDKPGQNEKQDEKPAQNGRPVQIERPVHIESNEHNAQPQLPPPTSMAKLRSSLKRTSPLPPAPPPTAATSPEQPTANTSQIPQTPPAPPPPTPHATAQTETTPTPYATPYDSSAISARTPPPQEATARRTLNSKSHPPGQPTPPSSGVSTPPASGPSTPPASGPPAPPGPGRSAPAGSGPPAPPGSSPPTPPGPGPAPPPGNQDKSKPRSGVNKFTNTDVSFDPNKEYASKTTNTAGQMYSEDEVTDSSSGPPPKPPASTELNLDECFAFAVTQVKRAGAFALVANKKKERLSYTTKEHEHDLNTRTDNEVEEMLVKAINEKYPTHKIIAEEAVSRTETGQVTLTNEPTWIIDPIDGTMNFVHHFPYYCISVALLIKKNTSFGIVYNPPLEEMYTARAGQGAKLNDEPMRTSGQEELKNAMILQEYSSGMNEARTTTALDNANRLIKKTHALRSIGSSAMGLAMVASGVADGFYFFGLHVWDMAAGNLLVTEAGGTVMDPAGGEVDIMSRRVLAAATQTLAFQLSAELLQNYPKPRDDESKLTPVVVPAPVPVTVPAPIPPPVPVPAPVAEPEPAPESAPAPTPPPVTPPESVRRDFNAQTEFTDSTMSLSSSENSRHSVVKHRN